MDVHELYLMVEAEGKLEAMITVSLALLVGSWRDKVLRGTAVCSTPGNILSTLSTNYLDLSKI